MTLDQQIFIDRHEFNQLHWAFGEFLVRRINLPDDMASALSLLAAKCLQAVEDGHSCLDLSAWHAMDFDETMADAKLPSPLSPEEWEQVLRAASAAVRFSTDVQQSPRDFYKPLFYDCENQCLYLQKYQVDEQKIADFVKTKITETVGSVPSVQDIKAINSLFRDKDFTKDPQQQAVAMALRSSFAILTGGPGTGKTTVLSTILALELKRNPQLRIALTAPTGKAAVQMMDSLNEEINTHLQLDDTVKNALTALPHSTLHRLLGARGDGTGMTYNRENPVPYDLVVVDEASMISLQLMGMLIDAMPLHGRLLLIGDQNQLTSVEAGSLLGDLCQCSLLNTTGGDSHITMLIENHRADNFDIRDFIQAMHPHASRALADSLPRRIDTLYQGTDPTFMAEALPTDQPLRQIKDQLHDKLEEHLDSLFGSWETPQAFTDFFTDIAPSPFSLEDWKGLHAVKNGDLADKAALYPLARAWKYATDFRILCGIHDTIYGEIFFNRLMADILDKQLYDDGVPVIVLKNDYVTDLMNGDVGICWDNRVYFPHWELNAGNLLVFKPGKPIAINQMPEHAMVYAMTIHKAQGAGFRNVLMVLPAQDHRLLSRELIYTGISRTKSSFQLWGPRDVFDKALDRPTKRWSGLRDLLK